MEHDPGQAIPPLADAHNASVPKTTGRYWRAGLGQYKNAGYSIPLKYVTLHPAR